MTTTRDIARRCTAQARFDTPLGPVLLARTEAGLAGAWFEAQKWHPAPLDAPERPDDPLLKEAATQITDYFAGRRDRFELPLDLHGSAFQRSVWAALCAIETGATKSYADVARSIGSPQAVRAVGAAVGRNPLSVIVPCHRVVGADGSLTGYAGGLHRKKALLNLEGAL
jgi:methylated-DNA-[protein]-cysteine S-methyltransferase